MKTFSIEKNLLISVPSSVLFDALTNSEKIIQYYPLEEVRSNWQVGGEIILKGSHEGQNFIDYGKIEIFTPPKQFQYTYWSDNHGTDRTPLNHMTICYSLYEVEQGTNLKLEHKNFKSEEMYQEMLNVWDFLLANLKIFAEKCEDKYIDDGKGNHLIIKEIE